jgi:hypothetical protein
VSVWTIRIHGEADDLFDAMLQTIGEGYIVRVEHPGFTGTAEFIAAAGRSITVRPYNDNPDTEERGEPVELDWEGLDVLEVI